MIQLYRSIEDIVSQPKSLLVVNSVSTVWTPNRSHFGFRKRLISFSSKIAQNDHTQDIEKNREKLVRIGPSFFKTFEIYIKFLGYQRTQPDESFSYSAKKL
jgi:hypothetical protein